MKLLFSSWRGSVVDNRGKSEDSWADCKDVELPEGFDADRRMTAFMGWDGFVVLGEPYDIVDMAYAYSRALRECSCGRCFPCRIGTSVMENLLGKIVSGRGKEADLEELTSLCESIVNNSKCGIGQVGPKPIIDTVLHFKSDYHDYISGRKKRSNGYRYPYKMTAPCTASCPTGMDIPKYIEHIKDADYAGSLATIREASPMASTLGRACFHPCENNCRRENVEATLQICKLKRVAWDWEDRYAVEKPVNPRMHTRDEKIAVIGGGPSGLSCAYYLALDGYRVTVFEKLDVFDGAAHTGIPQYRIPKETIGREVQYLEDIGVELKTGVDFGKDETFKSLREKGYKAFYLSTGADLSKKMRVDGESEGYKGFYKGIDVLKAIALGTEEIPVPKTTLVVGGGNTAMDCVRSFVRLGCPDVHIVYRRTEKEMPADPHEIHESKDEGVKYDFLVAPIRIVAKKGKVVGLECQKMELGAPDESGRRRPVPIKGSEYVIETDCVISAIGQDCDLAYLEEEPDLEKTSWSTIVTDEHTLQTNIPDIFAGGDVQTGPMMLVTACGHGRRAAQSMDQYLGGKEVRISDQQVMENLITKIGAYDKDEVVPEAKGRKRVDMPIISHDLKVGSFEEVETGLPLETAMEEAARCMRCYIVGMASVVGGNGKGV
jgi:formate dehydrogenase beta subunit